MLAEEGLEVFPSEANFLLVRWRPGKAREIREDLRRGASGCATSSGYPGLAGCLRVSVGAGRSLRETVRRCAEIRGTDPHPPAPSPDPTPIPPSPGEGESAGGETVERTTGETASGCALSLDGGPRRIEVPTVSSATC